MPIPPTWLRASRLHFPRRLRLAEGLRRERWTECVHGRWVEAIATRLALRGMRGPSLDACAGSASTALRSAGRRDAGFDKQGASKAQIVKNRRGFRYLRPDCRSGGCGFESRRARFGWTTIYINSTGAFNHTLSEKLRAKRSWQWRFEAHSDGPSLHLRSEHLISLRWFPLALCQRPAPCHRFVCYLLLVTLF